MDGTMIVEKLPGLPHELARIDSVVEAHKYLGIPQGLRVGAAGTTGFRQWRFVPRGWRSPIPYHYWCIVERSEEPDTWEHWRARLAGEPTMTWWMWWLDTPCKVQEEICYDEEARPILVCEGGLI
jgi:hypothetical protein